jgi:hypothetical protein
MSSDDSCISYEPSTLEILLPSPIILSTLCLSTDKTDIFIISIIRLTVFVLIYFLINDIIDFNDYQIIEYSIIIMICVNILYIGILVSKSPVFHINRSLSMFSQTIAKNKSI